MPIESKLYTSENPNEFTPEEKMSFAQSQTDRTDSQEIAGGMGEFPGWRTEQSGKDFTTDAATGQVTTPIVSPIQEKTERETNPPVVMSEDEWVGKKRELEMSALTPPPQYELPKIPLGLNIFMLTMDAFTGKANWLNFLLNDRKKAETSIKQKNEESASKFAEEAPIRAQKIQSDKLALDRQYYSGQRVKKQYGMQMGEREQSIRSQQMAISDRIARSEADLQELDFAIKNPKDGANITGLELKKKALEQYIKHDTERLKASRFSFIGAEIANQSEGGAGDNTDAELMGFE